MIDIPLGLLGMAVEWEQLASVLGLVQPAPVSGAGELLEQEKEASPALSAEGSGQEPVEFDLTL